MEAIVKFITNQLFNIGTALFAIILTIGIFIYQEWKNGKQKSRETIRLTEEIVNTIIRNSINSGISLSKVNLKALLDGFVLLKNCELNCGLDDLLKMVYAKVYENEHISKEIRPTLLKDIEDVMTSSQFEVVGNGNKRMGSIFMSANTAIISATLISILILLAIQTIEPQLPNINPKTLSPLPYVLASLIMLILIRTPRFERGLNILLEKNKVKTKQTNMPVEDFKEPSIPLESSKEEIKLQQVMTNSDVVMKVYEQRAIIEGLLKEIYQLALKQRMIYPVTRAVSQLTEAKIIDESLREFFRFWYAKSSIAVHEPEQFSSVEEIERLINNLKHLASDLHQIVLSFRKDNSTKSA